MRTSFIGAPSNAEGSRGVCSPPNSLLSLSESAASRQSLCPASKRYAHMLSGPIRSTIWTDHKPLVGFINSSTVSDIFARWQDVLRPLNVVIKHIDGKRNQVADNLSRTIFEDRSGQGT